VINYQTIYATSLMYVFETVFNYSHNAKLRVYVVACITSNFSYVDCKYKCGVRVVCMVCAYVNGCVKHVCRGCL